VPAGANARPTSTGAPQVIADVVITERQYEEEVTLLLQDSTTIRTVEIGITPEGVRVTISALAGDAVTTGSFFVRFTLSDNELNNFITVQADPPSLFSMNGNIVPSDAFVEVAYNEVVPAVFEAFDVILNQRLGTGEHDLDGIRFVAGQIDISLLVPLR